MCKDKVHTNTISNGELSDHLCDSVNRGLTLVRLGKITFWQNDASNEKNGLVILAKVKKSLLTSG